MVLHLARVDRYGSPPRFQNSSADFLDESRGLLIGIPRLHRGRFRLTRHPRRMERVIPSGARFAKFQNDVPRGGVEMKNFSAAVQGALAMDRAGLRARK